VLVVTLIFDLVCTKDPLECNRLCLLPLWETAVINAIVKGMAAREDAFINVLLFNLIFLLYVESLCWSIYIDTFLLMVKVQIIWWMYSKWGNGTSGLGYIYVCVCSS
jgi:hypothetical protein